MLRRLLDPLGVARLARAATASAVDNARRGAAAMDLARDDRRALATTTTVLDPAECRAPLANCGWSAPPPAHHADPDDRSQSGTSLTQPPPTR